MAAAEALFGTEYRRYTRTNADNGVNTTIVRAASRPQLPPAVRALVDFVSPADRFPVSRGFKVVHHVSQHDLARGLQGGVTPAVIRKQYNIGTVEGTGKTNQQSAAGFLGQYANLNDLQTFFNRFYTPAKGRTLYIIGPNNQNNPGLEASLDVQYLMAVGGNVNSSYCAKTHTRRLIDDDHNHGIFTFRVHHGHPSWGQRALPGVAHQR